MLSGLGAMTTLKKIRNEINYFCYCLFLNEVVFMNL